MRALSAALTVKPALATRPRPEFPRVDTGFMASSSPTGRRFWTMFRPSSMTSWVGPTLTWPAKVKLKPSPKPPAKVKVKVKPKVRVTVKPTAAKKKAIKVKVKRKA